LPCLTLPSPCHLSQLQTSFHVSCPAKVGKSTSSVYAREGFQRKLHAKPHAECRRPTSSPPLSFAIVGFHGNLCGRRCLHDSRIMFGKTVEDQQWPSVGDSGSAPNCGDQALGRLSRQLSTALARSRPSTEKLCHELGLIQMSGERHDLLFPVWKTEKCDLSRKP
jgi:hypothetical protein